MSLSLDQKRIVRSTLGKIESTLPILLEKASESRFRSAYKDICKGVHCKQVEKLEKKLGAVLEEMFEDQIRRSAKRLLGVAPSLLKHQAPGHSQSSHGRGGGGAAKPTPEGEVPSVPKVPASVKPKFDVIHEAAKTGDISKVEAIRTNPEAKSPYPKKLHQYKMDVLAAMAKKPPSPPPPEKPKPAPRPKPVEKPKPPPKPVTAGTGEYKRYQQTATPAEEKIAKETYDKAKDSYDKNMRFEHDARERIKKAASDEEKGRAFQDQARAEARRSQALRQMITQRNSVHAVDREGYLKETAKRDQQLDEWQKDEDLFISDLVSDGVIGKEPYYTLGSSSIRVGVGNRDYKLDSYKNLTNAHINRAEELQSRRASITDGARLRITNRYYGEPDVPRDLGKIGGDEVSVPSKVFRGGGGGTKTMMEQSEVAIQVAPKVVKNIAASGRMKNAFEGGRGSIGAGKSDYKAIRKEVENGLFGHTDTTPSADRPIYGYLEHPDRLKSSGADIGSNYGTVQLILKPEVKARTSFTIGDSLNNRHQSSGRAGAVNDPPPALTLATKKILRSANHARGWRVEHDFFGDEGAPISYMEAQIHKGVQISDIQAIRIPHDSVQLSSGHLKKFSKAGVTIEEVAPPFTRITSVRDWDDYYKDS